MALEILEILELFAYGFFGWRYIFSSTFRERTHKRWKFESRLTICLEIFFGAVGIVLTLLPVWLMARYVW